MKTGILWGLFALLLVGCTSSKESREKAADFEVIEWGRHAEYARKAYDEALEHLAMGRQKDAEWVVATACKSVPDSQRLIFLRGVLLRSRFENTGARESFSSANARSKDTIPGRASFAVVAMDSGYGSDYAFKALNQLVEENPDEVLVRWLYGIEAASHTKHAREADEQFKAILKEWEVGPVMLHRTYADLLGTDLGRPEDALPHRMLVVEQEPDLQSYQELANSLMTLRRLAEADQAYGKMLEMDPYNPAYWILWGNCRFYMKDYPSAVEKYTKAHDLDPKDVSGLVYSGRCLEKLGRIDDGFANYAKAVELNPAHPFACAYAAYSKLYGYGTWPDYDWALELCAASAAEFAEAGDTALVPMVARIDGSPNPLAPEPSKVLLPHLVALAEKGNTDAQFNLGMIYYHGIGLPRDWNKSIAWFRKAAAQKHTGAQAMLKEFEVK